MGVVKTKNKKQNTLEFCWAQPDLLIAKSP